MQTQILSQVHDYWNSLNLGEEKGSSGALKISKK